MIDKKIIELVEEITEADDHLESLKEQSAEWRKERDVAIEKLKALVADEQSGQGQLGLVKDKP